MIKIFPLNLLPNLEKNERVDQASNLPKNVFKEHVYANSCKNRPYIFEKIPVSQTAFYDLGFDPDFSSDGNFFYKEQLTRSPTLKFLLVLTKMIRSIVRYYTSFFQTPEQKAFQKLLKIEKNWQKAAQAKGMLYPETQIWEAKAPFILELREHQFFQQLSKVTNLNGPNLYPSELLKPLHGFNRPQLPSLQSKEDILRKGVLNTDVSRLSMWGFNLLANDHERYFIDHNAFLQSIEVSGDKLKYAIRELRMVLRKGDYEKFHKTLERFKTHWKEYIESHDLLQDLACIYLQKDFFAKRYQGLEEVYQEMQNVHLYYHDHFLENIHGKFKDIHDYNRECSAQLYQAVLSTLPNSLIAQKYQS